jgi:hypothetical protein
MPRPKTVAVNSCFLAGTVPGGPRSAADSPELATSPRVTGRRAHGHTGTETGGTSCSDPATGMTDGVDCARSGARDLPWLEVLCSASWRGSPVRIRIHRRHPGERIASPRPMVDQPMQHCQTPSIGTAAQARRVWQRSNPRKDPKPQRPESMRRSIPPTTNEEAPRQSPRSRANPTPWRARVDRLEMRHVTRRRPKSILRPVRPKSSPRSAKANLAHFHKPLRRFQRSSVLPTGNGATDLA